MSKQNTDTAGRAAEEAQAAAAPANETTAAEELRRENEQLQAELQAANDRVLRAEAETDNTRKRLRRDFDDQLRFASLPLLKDVLGVLDNLERAIEASRANETQSALREGVQMVAGQLKSVLSQHHCREIEAAPGATFDPHRHEALGQEPSDLPAGSVSRLVRPGYQMHDRVVRAAQVLLSAGKPS